MSWEAWAARIGGFVAAPWTGGASIPIGLSVGQALDQKDAIKKAETQQTTATGQAKSAIDTANQQTQQAIANAQQGVQGATSQAQAALAPYQQLGGQGANALSNLMGFGGLSAPAAPTAAPVMAAGPTIPMAPPPSLPSGEPGGHATLAPLVTDDNLTPDMRPSLARAIAARSQNASSYSGPNVQGPGGKFYRIPEDQIEAALADGGRRLPGNLGGA